MAEEIARLESVAPPGVDVGELLHGAGIEPERCLDNFRAAKIERRAKLSAVELHRIAQGLIDVAAADGRIAENEVVQLLQDKRG